MIAVPYVVADDSGFAERTQFYDAVRAGNDTAAVRIGKQYLAAHPGDDAFALDLAYAEVRAGDRTDALALLAKLAKSTNAKVAATADTELAAMNGSASAPLAVDRGYAYGYAQNEARFGDNIFGGNVRYDLTSLSAVVPYAIARVNYDTRSGIPGIGQIYEQSAAVASAGLRAPLGIYAYAFVDAGYSFGLRGQPSFPEARYGILGSRDYGDLDGPKPHTLLDGSIAEYSRFQGNIIGYGQINYDPVIAGHLRAIGGFSLNFDTHRLYYNNYGEAFGGLLYRLSPTLSLRAVEAGGTYLPRGIDLPSQRGYTTFRALLVFGQGLR